MPYHTSQRTNRRVTVCRRISTISSSVSSVTRRRFVGDRGGPRPLRLSHLFSNGTDPPLHARRDRHRMQFPAVWTLRVGPAVAVAVDDPSTGNRRAAVRADWHERGGERVTRSPRLVDRPERLVNPQLSGYSRTPPRTSNATAATVAAVNRGIAERAGARTFRSSRPSTRRPEPTSTRPASTSHNTTIATTR